MRRDCGIEPLANQDEFFAFGVGTLRTYELIGFSIFIVAYLDFYFTGFSCSGVMISRVDEGYVMSTMRTSAF